MSFLPLSICWFWSCTRVCKILPLVETAWRVHGTHCTIFATLCISIIIAKYKGVLNLKNSSYAEVSWFDFTWDSRSWWQNHFYRWLFVACLLYFTLLSHFKPVETLQGGKQSCLRPKAFSVIYNVSPNFRLSQYFPDHYWGRKESFTWNWEGQNRSTDWEGGEEDGGVGGPEFISPYGYAEITAASVQLTLQMTQSWEDQTFHS